MKIIKNIIGALNVPKVITAIKGGDVKTKTKGVTLLAGGGLALFSEGVVLITDGVTLKDTYSIVGGVIMILVAIFFMERMGDKISKIDSDADNE